MSIYAFPVTWHWARCATSPFWEEVSGRIIRIASVEKQLFPGFFAVVTDLPRSKKQQQQQKQNKQTNKQQQLASKWTSN